MQNKEELLNKLKKEHSDLLEKTNKLEKFLQTKEFDILSDYHKNLLSQQFNAMCLYNNCLAFRIFDIEYNYKK